MGIADEESRQVQGQPPLWQTVQSQLLARIDAGEFSAGFPGELALAEEYSVSRATIRAALAPLRRAGRITAQRGRPSAVVNVANERRFGPVYSLFAAVEGAGMTQHSVVDLAELQKNAQMAARLGLQPEAELVFISRTRLADDEVIAVDETWLPASLAEAVLGADLSHTALYEVLRDRCGVILTAGRETLHAVSANASQSKRLNCECGAALFFIERIGLAGDVAVEFRRTLIRGDKFTVTTSYPG